MARAVWMYQWAVRIVGQGPRKMPLVEELEALGYIEAGQSPRYPNSILMMKEHKDEKEHKTD